MSHKPLQVTWYHERNTVGMFRVAGVASVRQHKSSLVRNETHLPPALSCRHFITPLLMQETIHQSDCRGGSKKPRHAGARFFGSHTSRLELWRRQCVVSPFGSSKLTRHGFACLCRDKRHKIFRGKAWNLLRLSDKTHYILEGISHKCPRDVTCSINIDSSIEATITTNL